jgi:hypothetical protein
LFFVSPQKPPPRCITSTESGTLTYLKADNIWRLYNQGTVVEQVIEEIKNDFAANHMYTKGFLDE